MVTTQEKQKYCNILQVGLDASQEEIAKAYKKMALKYHPDRNHGKEEWAKQEFIKVGEAYSVLSGKQESGSSNKFSSDAEFEKFKEMFEEVEREFKETKREFYEYKENKKQEDKAARSEAIRKIEEDLTSSNVSVSELDSSLWAPYRDWKEKVENSVGSGIDVFSGDMRIDINRAKRAKINNSSSGQRGYTHGSYSEQSHDNREKYGNYGNFPTNSWNENYSSYNSGWTGENKSFSTSGDKIAKLEDEIEWNKQCLLRIYDESEKERCRKQISQLEKDLRKLKGSSDSDKGEKKVPNPSYNSPGNYGSSNNSGDNKNETIEQLKAKIEQLRNNKKWRLWSSKEDKKLAEMEQKLSELESNNSNNEDDDSYIYLSREQLDQIVDEAVKRAKYEDEGKFNEMKGVVQQLEEEVERLRAEVQELKKERSDNNYSEFSDYYLVKKESELKYKENKLEQLKEIFNSNSNSNSNSNFPTSLIIGGAVLIAIIGLGALIFVKKVRKAKLKR